MRAAAQGALAAALLAAAPARADVARVLSALPDVPPDRGVEPPKGLSAGERVAGVWVSTPHTVPVPPGAGKQRQTRAVVVAPAAVPVDLAAAPTTTFTVRAQAVDPKADACLRASAEGVSWSPPASTSAMLLEGQPADVTIAPPDTARETASHDVWMVRAERFVDGKGDKASLEQIDAWVDLRTGGAREVARRSVPLALVQRFAGGLAVFGYRQDGRALLLVRPARVNLVADGGPPSPAVLLEGGEGTAGHCGHKTVALSVDAAGQSASEAVVGEVSVPVEESGEGKRPPTFKARNFRLTLTEAWSRGEPSAAIGATFGWFGAGREDGRQFVAARQPMPGRIRRH